MAAFKIRKNPDFPNKIVYTPSGLKKTYLFQENKYRISRIQNFQKYHRRKLDFLKTQTGQKFLNYKLEKYGKIHGLDIWFVDGNALRSKVEAGDVDFTMGGHGYRYLYVPKYEIWIDILYKGKAEFWPVFWHEYLERSLMRLGKSYSAAHTYASKLEIVLREGGFFVLPVGTYRQAVPGTCGPSALKIILDFLRWPLKEKYLAKLCQTTIEKGTGPLDIIRVSKELNFKVKNWENLTVKKAKELIKKGLPIIANFQSGPKIGDGHYAVIIGFSDSEFILSDPGLDTGYVRVKIKDFMKNWYELEDKTVRQGITLEAP